MPTRYPSTMRARDEDRVHACSTLDEAFADGQLPADEYELRIELAKDAHTLADLHDLIDDLQGDTELVEMAPPGRSIPTLPGRKPTLMGALVRWVVLIALVAAVFFGVRACLSDESATGVYGSAGYLSRAAISDVLASAIDRAGTSAVDEISFRSDYVVLDVQDAQNPRKEWTYSFRNGEWDDGSDHSRDIETRTVDLTAFDPTVLAGLVAGAGESLNLARIDSLYFVLQADERGPYVSLHAGNEDNEGGNVDATPAGDFMRVTPFDPEK